VRKTGLFLGVLFLACSAFSAEVVRCSDFAGVVVIDGSRLSAEVASGLEGRCANPYQCMPSLPAGSVEVRMLADLSPRPTLPRHSVLGSLRCSSIESLPKNIIVLYDDGIPTNWVQISMSSTDECVAGLEKISQGQKIKFGFRAVPSVFGWNYVNGQLCN
jgi:hypothetical protein